MEERAVAAPTPAAATTATLGIDLASQPRNTALCAIVWAHDRADIVALFKGADEDATPIHDQLIVSAMRGLRRNLPAPSKVAIDAPLGWPVDFARAIGSSAAWPVGLGGNRRRLERRATDCWVHRDAAKLPLSVTTDRIAYAAMRAAGVLSHYAATYHETIDRSGMAGLVCEAYPDPAIRKLNLWPQGTGGRDSYKGDARGLREKIVGRLMEEAPWLHLSPTQRRACIDSDDCLDALICALVARAAERGLTIAPPAALAAEAEREGWIHLPAAPFVWARLLDDRRP